MEEIEKRKFQRPPIPERRQITDWERQLFLDPLMEGWRREVVTRANPSKTRVDVYYFSPEGRKFRSRPEIARYFSENSINRFSAEHNFNFTRGALGNEFAPYETVRHAHTIGKRLSNSRISQKNSILQRKRLLSARKRKITTKSKRKACIRMGDPNVSSPLILTGDDIFSSEPDYFNDTTKIDNVQNSSERGMELFCVCNDIEHGNMVLCDNTNCQVGWYHFDCVKLLVKPEGTWYCPSCRGESEDVMESLFSGNGD